MNNVLPLCRWIGIAVLVVSAWGAGGCSSSYATPGGPAPLRSMTERNMLTDADLRDEFEKEALAQFPASVAVVRVQESGYRSHSARGYGQGAFSVVTVRDVETEAQMQRLASLPLVEDIAPVNRLLLDPNLSDDRPLRAAAARVRAELLLVYTFDTRFTNEDKIKPLSVVTLGLSPNRKVSVTSTASAVLMDTRNGYIYGLAEATADGGKFTNAWQDATAADETRRQVEQEAFNLLVDEIETMWTDVVARYAPDRLADDAGTTRPAASAQP